MYISDKDGNYKAKLADNAIKEIRESKTLPECVKICYVLYKQIQVTHDELVVGRKDAETNRDYQLAKLLKSLIQDAEDDKRYFTNRLNHLYDEHYQEIRGES